MWPQVLYLLLISIGLGVNLAQHGKPKEGKYSVWNSVVALIIVLSLLTWGGFFNCFFD